MKTLGFAVINTETEQPIGKLYRRRGDAARACTVHTPADWSLPYDDRRAKQKADSVGRFRIAELGEKPEGDWVCVRADELERLNDRDEWLSDLENAGVDNWGGIDFAHELRRDRRGF
jgi:hypothetical protein